MPTFRVTGGALSGVMMSGNYPDNSLPDGGQGAVDPGWGVSGDRPSNPIVLPPAPPGIWPPPTVGNPIAPIIDNTLPVAPGTIWPSPGRPPHVDAGLPPSSGHPGGGPMPGGERPDNTLPGGQGGEITNPIQPRTFWMLCIARVLGGSYVSVDPSLRPDQGLPPSAQPR